MEIGEDEDLMRKWEELLRKLEEFFELMDQVRIEIQFQIQLKIDS